MFNALLALDVWLLGLHGGPAEVLLNRGCWSFVQLRGTCQSPGKSPSGIPTSGQAIYITQRPIILRKEWECGNAVVHMGVASAASLS